MDTFLNPYNFISFPPKKASAYKEKEMQCHTGVIYYTITTKSPLFIPNSSTEKAFSQSNVVKEHKSYDFFSYTQLSDYKDEEGNPKAAEPVIPGSQIRGVIRSVYETLTDSCMGVLNSDTFPIKRTSQKFEPALIKKDKNGYKLIRAKSFSIGQKAEEEGEPPKNFQNNSNGTLIYFKKPKVKEDKKTGKKMPGNCITEYRFPEENENSENPFDRSGYLIKWGMGCKKVRYHLFVQEKDREEVIREVPLSREVLKIKLIEVIESYLKEPAIKETDKSAYNEYKNDLQHFMDTSCDKATYFPVNYSVLSDGMFYLSPATFTKEISNNSIGKLAGEFAPCNETEECPACELFGHIAENNENARGSKIRFSDLYVTDEREKNEYYQPLLTLPALSAPKLGNVEFYLKKPQNADFWTYDYYIENENLTIEPALLRGRKYYWHHMDTKIPSSIEPSKLNKTIRPLQSEVTFSGKLYFENISEKQLKQLMWICNSSKEGLGYKLGAAKPFGFGSVSCEVIKIEERIICIENGQIVYKIDKDKKEQYQCTYEEAGFSTHCKEQFYRIAGFNLVKKGMEITYPKTLEQKTSSSEDEGFCWYVENHKTTNGKKMISSRKYMKICLTLPTLEDKDVGLPYCVSKANTQYAKNNQLTHFAKPPIASKHSTEDKNLPYNEPHKGTVKEVNDMFLVVEMEEEHLELKIPFKNLKGKRDKILKRCPKSSKVEVTCIGKIGDSFQYKVERCE